MLRITVIGCLLATFATAQQPQSPSRITCNERYVYVLRGDQLLQFDADTLVLVRQTMLLDTQTTRRATEVELRDTRLQEESEEPILRDVEIAEEEPVEELAPLKKAAAEGNAVARGLAWLATHQDPDGRWDADEFMKHDASGEPCTGAGTPTHDLGVTSLATLAFLGAGNTHKVGPHAAAVDKALRWLQREQAADGCFSTRSHHDYVYDHAIATTAMCEALALSSDEALRDSAQRAVNYLESHRNPYSVWRYQPRDGDNDTSVTSWCLFAYRAAQDAGLEVRQEALAAASTWLDLVTDPESGRVGYTKRGEISSRHPGDHSSRFPPDRTEALTAAGLFCRFLLGQNPESHPVMERSAARLVARQPDPKDAKSVDHYYWYYGSLAMYQMGGKHWKAWVQRLRNDVARSQRTDGSATGSWDPVGVWGQDGGRVYSTALMTLALESAYRYARVR